MKYIGLMVALLFVRTVMCADNNLLAQKNSSDLHPLTPEGIQSLEISSSNGDKSASFRLAEYYQIIALNRELYVHWLQISSNQGHVTAQFNYGIILLNTVEQHDEGMRLLRLSAEQGNTAASFQYGYELIKFNKENKDGILWIVKAAKYDDESALLYLITYYIKTVKKVKSSIYWLNRYLILQATREREKLSFIDEIDGEDIHYRSVVPEYYFNIYSALLQLHLALEMMLNKPTFSKGFRLFKNYYKDDIYAIELYKLIIENKYTP